MRKIKNFEHFMHRIEQQCRAEKNRAAKISGPVQLRKKNGDFAIIHPATYGESPWQVSMFDEKGPYSDHKGTLLEVAIMAIEEGFRKEVKEVLL